MTEVPIDVMHDMENKEREYANAAERLYKQAEKLHAEAEVYAKIRSDTLDMISKWKALFPEESK